MNHVLFQAFGAVPKAPDLPSNEYASPKAAANLPPMEGSRTQTAYGGNGEEIQEKRNRLREYCKKKRDKLSFVNLLDVDLNGRQSSEQSSSDEEEAEEDQEEDTLVAVQRRVVIDVDKELGLAGSSLWKKKRKRDDLATTRLRPRADGRKRKTTVALTPKDKGYYEGVTDLSLPEDQFILSPRQVWIRQQLQLFSAFEGRTVQGHRRVVVPGRVGIRCRHCAHQQMLDGIADDSSIQLDSVGSAQGGQGVSCTFPNTVSLLYVACSQRTSSLLAHLESCPNMSSDGRKSYQALLQDPRTQRRRSMAVSTYYAISSRRIGLIDVSEGGIRFGRDLSIDPLPWDRVRSEFGGEVKVEGGSQTRVARLTADEESERVLAEALMQSDDSQILGRSEDKDQVSDFIFLTMRQMMICNASRADFESRGKRSKFLRLGLAGFCCRHCHQVRSYSSAADNLSSAISNSFTAHLLKCPYAGDIPRALSNYKRLHARQMNMLPYGSQRRCFQAVWGRLREHDKSEEEMKNLEPEIEPKTEEGVPSTETAAASSPPPLPEPAPRSSDYSLPSERPINFPVTNDVAATTTLTNAMEDWDSSENDNLLLREDLPLVSDFLFLILRQMKFAVPDASDRARMKGRQLAAIAPGLCCIHCAGKEAIVPSGRTFPSAPDNFASALNTSLFKHMKTCPYLPMDIRHALLITRKIHSQQCSSLKFGSQRRFFTILFSRLREHKYEVPVAPLDPPNIETGSKANIESLGFVLVRNARSEEPPLFLCRHCRMVPLPFRAPHAVITDSKAIVDAETHTKLCYKDKCDISAARDILCEGLSGFFEDVQQAAKCPEFVEFADHVCGGDSELREQIMVGNNHMDRHPYLIGEVWSRFPRTVDSSAVCRAFSRFCQVVSGKSPVKNISEAPCLLRWALLMAPSFEPVGVQNEDQMDSEM